MLQSWLKMTTEIKKFASFTYFHNKNQLPAVYQEVPVVIITGIHGFGDLYAYYTYTYSTYI